MTIGAPLRLWPYLPYIFVQLFSWDFHDYIPNYCLKQIRGGRRSSDHDRGQQLPLSATDDAEPAEAGTDRCQYFIWQMIQIAKFNFKLKVNRLMCEIFDSLFECNPAEQPLRQRGGQAQERHRGPGWRRWRQEEVRLHVVQLQEERVGVWIRKAHQVSLSPF